MSGEMHVHGEKAKLRREGRKVFDKELFANQHP
jgi:hypothetical protein